MIAGRGTDGRAAGRGAAGAGWSRRRLVGRIMMRSNADAPAEPSARGASM